MADTNPMIELYHCPGGRSLRCLWLLEEMGLPYKLHVLPFPPRMLAPEFLELNPLGTIPLVVDGDTRMTESAAILEYLTVKYGPTPLGVAPSESAYGAWLNWLHLGEASLTTPQTVALVYGMFVPEADRKPDVQAHYVGVFIDKLKVLEPNFTQDYLCAGRFTVADISVAYAMTLAPYIGADTLMPEAAKEYLARMTARPAFQRAAAAQGQAA